MNGVASHICQKWAISQVWRLNLLKSQSERVYVPGMARIKSPLFCWPLVTGHCILLYQSPCPLLPQCRALGRAGCVLLFRVHMSAAGSPSLGDSSVTWYHVLFYTWSHLQSGNAKSATLELQGRRKQLEHWMPNGHLDVQRAQRPSMWVLGMETKLAHHAQSPGTGIQGAQRGETSGARERHVDLHVDPECTFQTGKDGLLSVWQLHTRCVRAWTYSSMPNSWACLWFFTWNPLPDQRVIKLSNRAKHFVVQFTQLFVTQGL